jgi:hypothetical protein
VNYDPHIFVLKETQPRPGGALFESEPDLERLETWYHPPLHE